MTAIIPKTITAYSDLGPDHIHNVAKRTLQCPSCHGYVDTDLPSARCTNCHATLITVVTSVKLPDSYEVNKVS